MAPPHREVKKEKRRKPFFLELKKIESIFIVYSLCANYYQ